MDLQLDNVINTYESGLVQRYHTHPRFARFGQTDAAHQWGVMMLTLQLHPDPSKSLLIECAAHDTGERFSADLPSPVKRLDPILAELFDKLELNVRIKRTIAPLRLTGDEHKFLKCMDVLECYLFAAHTLPEALDTPNWERLRKYVIDSSHQLLLQPLIPVEDVMEAAKQRQGFVEAY